MVHAQALREDVRCPPIDAPAFHPLPKFQPRLAQLVSALDRAVHPADPAADETPAGILSHFVGEPDLLDGIACPASSEHYTRHLLHAGWGFSVLAVAWRPGQMSPVHGHHTWYALGVHHGSLTESLFSLTERGLRLNSCRQHHPGAISHSPADGDAIHRIANLGTETAVSIHVYGVAFDRLGAGVNRVLAD